MQHIISQHNMNADYQQIATANMIPGPGSQGQPANTLLDPNGRITAFNRRSLIQ